MLIIEDRPKFDIPIGLYKALMFISYLQVFLYLLPTSSLSTINDVKLQSTASIAKVISLSNILAMQDSDTQSVLVYLGLTSFMIGYFFYVALYSLIKHFQRAFYEQHLRWFIGFNQILNFYFSLFIHIFYTIFIEINSSLLFCSQRSLFYTQRKSSQAECVIPAWQYCAAIFGIFLTLVTAWIACYFFRNFEFMEYNKIKRRQNFLYLLIISCKFACTIYFFQESNEQNYAQHLLTQFMALISLLDYFLNFPYSDTEVRRFYLIVLSWFYVLVCVSHLWVFTSFVDDEDFFYFVLVIGVPFQCFLLSASSQRQDTIMLTRVAHNHFPQKLDFFLEEFARLAFESRVSEISKVVLFKLFKCHLNICSNKDCPCRSIEEQIIQSNQKGVKQSKTNNNTNNGQEKSSQSLFQRSKSGGGTNKTRVNAAANNGKFKENSTASSNLTDSSELQVEHVLDIIDSTFKFYLQQSIVNKNQVEYEHLSLKYITFMIKYLKNYTRANYELKLLQFQREDFSPYFKIISRFISSSIQNVISKMNIDLESMRKEEITVQQLVEVDEICERYMPLIMSTMQAKVKMWTSLQKGYHNMNFFQEEAVQLMRDINALRMKFLIDMNFLAKEYKVSQSLKFQKLNMIFYLFVMNDNIRAYELENLVHDLRKRDSLKPINILTNENNIRECIATLTISISQNIGRITSRKDEKTASFFGYSKQDFQKIQKVNELMPTFIGRKHDNIIRSFVNRGHSDYIKQSKLTFFRNQVGFIVPIKLYLDFSFFSENDFQVNGTMLKINAAYDYLVFHRSGQFVGITQRLAAILFNSHTTPGHKLPTGDTIISSMHAFLLIPQITKRIFKRKEQILKNNLVDGDTLLIDCKSSIIIKSSYFSEMKRLLSFVNRQSNLMNYSSKRQNNYTTAIESLDLFSEESHSLMRNYHNQEMNSTSQAQSSDRKEVNAKSMSNPNSEMLMNHQKLRLKFTYTLSFNYLSSNFSANEDLYFQMRLHDLNVSKVKNRIRTYFRTNVCTFLFSTTSIGQIDRALNQKQGKNDSNHLILEQEEYNNDASNANGIVDWVFTPEDIPKKTLKLAQVGSNLKLNFGEGDQDEYDGHNINNSGGNNGNYNNRGQYNQQSEESEDDENDDYEDENGEDKDEISIRQLNRSKKVLDQYDECKHAELNDVLGDNEVSEDKLNQIDPYFKLKKIMQKRSLQSAFSRALEKAIVEALFEINSEKIALSANSNTHNNQADHMLTFREQNDRTVNQLLHNQKSSGDAQRQNYLGANSGLGTSSLLVSSQKYIRDSFKSQDFDEKMQNQQKQAVDKLLVYKEAFIDQNSSNILLHKDNNQDDKSSFFDVSYRPLVAPQQQEQREAIELTNLAENEFRNPSEEDESIAQLGPSINQITFQIPTIKKQSSEREQYTAQRSSSSKFQEFMSNQKPKAVGGTTAQSSATSGLLKPTPNLLTSIGKGGSTLLRSTQDPESSVDKNGDNGDRERKLIEAAAMNRSDLSQQENDDQIDGFSDKEKENVVLQVLNQQGIVNNNDAINKGSIHSSSKSSNSYGGNFLKEIILMRKLPRHSYQYSLLLILFIFAFIALNLTNLVIIQNDMQSFSGNVVILRQPRKFLRAYGRCILAYLIESEIQVGLTSDPDGSLDTLRKNYLNYCSSEYLSLIQQYSSDMMSYLQLMQNDNGQSSREYSIYQDQQLSKQDIDLSLMFNYNFNFVIGIQANQTEQRRMDSYLYLRQNFFQFSTDILDFGTYLVSTVQTTVDNLVDKFTIIAIAAISGIILVAMISLPIIRFINLYEEKILMIVSRINYDHSQVEKLKFNVCAQMLNVGSHDWLRHTYQDIFSLRFNQFNVSIINNQHDLQKISTRKSEGFGSLFGQQSKIVKASAGTATVVTGTTKTPAKRIGKSEAGEKVKRSRVAKRFADANSSNMDSSLQSTNNEQYQASLKKSLNKNYILQSKISNQRLSIFRRFIPLLLLTVCSTIYFLVIILYIKSNKDFLKSPVEFNKNTIQYHISQSTLKISAELLAFNNLIEKNKFTKLQSEGDLENYQSIMNQMLSISKERADSIKSTVYGSSGFPSDRLSQLIDFQEGKVCQYLKKFSCDQSQVGQVYGVNYILQEKFRVIRQYSKVIAAIDTTDDLVIDYGTSSDHKNTFLRSFLIEDEVIDLQSSTGNLTIGDISSQIQTFLEQYLLYFGNSFAGIAILVCLLSWRQLYNRIQLMNLLLTFIPDEKLLEEVTLQMLKSLRTM